MPTIFPKLLQVAQRPIMRPLFFLENQADKIATKVGNATELNIPIKPKTK